MGGRGSIGGEAKNGSEFSRKERNLDDIFKEAEMCQNTEDFHSSLRNNMRVKLRASKDFSVDFG